jgi:hypothetical protein
LYCTVCLDRVPKTEQFRGDRQDMRQDGQQETGWTAKDRTDSKGQDRKVRLSKMTSRTTM